MKSSPQKKVKSSPHKKVKSSPHKKVKLSPHKKVKSSPHKKVKSSPHKSNPMRGWAKSAPKKGNERKLMLSKCGSSCFLLPKTLAFPVCPRSLCKISCKGLLAAKSRARQYKYTEVIKKATTLQKKLKC